MNDKGRTCDPPSSDTAGIAGGADPAERSRWLGIALHPFLFGAASVLSLYASNLREASLSDMTSALAAVLGAALVLLLVIGAALGSFGQRAAILASVVLVTSLFYGPLVAWINGLAGSGLSLSAALPIMAAAMAVLVVIVARLRGDLTAANVILNAVAIVLFITPAWKAASHEWKTARGSPLAAEATSEDRSAVDARLRSVDRASLNSAPDIYYLIFDRYGSQAVLAEHFAFDNRDLVEFLKAKGFYVASESHSNYLKTAHSLASTLHMDYINHLSEQLGPDATDWRPVYDMLGDHRVGRFLKSIGYKFIQIGAWWRPTHYNPYADENYSFGFSEFNYQYLRKTIVPPLLAVVAPASTYALRLRWDNGQCQRVPQQIAKIEATAERAEATFVFAHILVPHGPYVFDRSGRCLALEEVSARGERRGYVEQVRYANLLIRDAVSALLAKPGTKPIIIVQADEGPFPKRYEFGNPSWRAATAAELRLKTGILNAYYFPDGDYSDLYQDITPINTFRIVFNKHFNTRFERLSDRIYAFEDIFNIYDFFDVTDTVQVAK